MFVAFVLKENGEQILTSLDTISNKTEELLKDGYKLTKEMKSNKIKDMKAIDEKFEKVVKAVQMKKA